MCLTEGVCLVARASTGSAVQQQCSSAEDRGWRFVPDAILLAHRSLDVAEYGVRSAVETTSAMVKLTFELSLVC